MAETLCSQCRGLGLIPGWETRSHVLPVKIPNGRTKTWCRGREGGRGKRRKERREEGAKEEPGSPSHSGASPVSLCSPLVQGERNRKWPKASGTGERDCPLRQQGSGQQCTWLNVPPLEKAPRYKEAPNSLDFLITLQGPILPSIQETRSASITARRTKVTACVPCAKSFAKLPL